MAVDKSGPYVYPAILGGAAFSVGDALSIAQVQQAAKDLNHILYYRRPVLASGANIDDYGDESAVAYALTEADASPDTITVNGPYMGPRASVLLHRPFTGLQFYFRARAYSGTNKKLYYAVHSDDLPVDEGDLTTSNLGFLAQGYVTIADTTPTWYTLTLAAIDGIPDTRVLRFTTQSFATEEIRVGVWILSAYMA